MCVFFFFLNVVVSETDRLIPVNFDSCPDSTLQAVACQRAHEHRGGGPEHAALTVTLVVVVVSGRVARPIPMTITTSLAEVAIVTIAMPTTTCSRRRVGVCFVY